MTLRGLRSLFKSLMLIRVREILSYQRERDDVVRLLFVMTKRLGNGHKKQHALT